MSKETTKPYDNVDFFEDLTGSIPEATKEELVGRTYGR